MQYSKQALKRFQIEEDPFSTGRFRVVMHITCLASNFAGASAYPRQLRKYAYENGPTSFTIIVKDQEGEYLEDMSFEDAIAVSDELEDRYAETIKYCEDHASWDMFPELSFDEDDVIFCK